MLPSILPGRHAGRHLEGAIKRRERLKAGVEGDGEDRHVRLDWIGECGSRFRQAVAVDEAAEIAVAESLVDESPEPIFGYRKPCGQDRNVQPITAVKLLFLHQLAQRLQKCRLLLIQGSSCRRLEAWRGPLVGSSRRNGGRFVPDAKPQ